MAGHDGTSLMEAMSQSAAPGALLHETEMMMAASGAWEHLIQPAPFAIYLIGHLMLIATRSPDVSLVENQPRSGYAYIRYPNSLRASLLHMSHEGYNAFLMAHVNIDYVRINTLMIPRMANHVIRILERGTPEDANSYLPVLIGHIDRQARENKQLADAVIVKFDAVRYLIEELYTACTNADSAAEYRMRVTIAKQQLAAEEKELMRQESEMHKEALQKYQNRVSEMQENFFEAQRQLARPKTEIWPSVIAGMIGAGVAVITGGMSTAATAAAAATSGAGSSALFGFGAGFGLSQMAMAGQQDTLMNVEMPSGGVRNPRLRSYAKLQSVHRTFVDSIGKVRSLLLQTGLLEGNLSLTMSDDGIGSASKAHALLDNMVEKVRDAAGAQDQPEAHEILTRGAEVASRIVQGASGNDTIESLRRFLVEASAFEMRSRASLGVNPTDNTQPISPDDMETMPQATKTAQLTELAFRVKSAQEMLSTALSLHDAQLKRYQEKMAELRKITLKLHSLDLDRVSLQQIRETLQEAIGKLSELTAQWRKISHFFQTISMLVTGMNKPLDLFITTSNISMPFVVRGQRISEVARDMLYTYGLKAAIMSRIVNNMASVYSEVSDKYLMREVRALGRIDALARSGNAEQVLRLKDEMWSTLNATTNEISQYAARRRQQLHEKTARLIEKRQELLQQAGIEFLPETHKEIIDEATRLGVKNSTRNEFTEV